MACPWAKGDNLFDKSCGLDQYKAIFAVPDYSALHSFSARKDSAGAGHAE